MRTLTVREMRAALPDLERLLESEGELLVTRRGKAVARILPAVKRGGMPTHADLRAKMPRVEVGSEVLIRQDRDER